MLPEASVRPQNPFVGLHEKALAEGMRFELTMGFPPYTLSKRAP